MSMGLAFLARTVWEATSLTAVCDGLVERITQDPDDAGAKLDFSMLLQLTGNREQGLNLQAQALAQQQCYRKSHGAGDGVRILAFVIASDLMGNTPIDFLLEGSDVELTTFYVDGSLPPPADLPDHDVAFLAIGESEENNPILDELRTAFRGWPRPVVNGRPEMIAALTRDGVATKFVGHPLVAAPQTHRLRREHIGTDLPGDLRFPIIVRPVGTHAGNGMQKVNDALGLAAYLAEHPEREFFVAQFVDYSGPDGLFRKLRIAFILGRPYISHMAVSPRWMVHYLNADMEASEANRAEEARMMATFDEDFAARHAAAFQALNDAIGLDYYGIDCAETPDGQLLLFEADVAMIVHTLDPDTLYPYKKPAMAKLFGAFVAAMATVAQGRQ